MASVNAFETELSRLPRFRAVLQIDGKGKLTYFWPKRNLVTSPIGMTPGGHTFLLQAERVVRDRSGYGTSDEESQTSVVRFKGDFEPGVAYALFAIMLRGDNFFYYGLRPLGKLGEAKPLPQLLDSYSDDAEMDFLESKWSVLAVRRFTRHYNAMVEVVNSEKPRF